MYEYEWYVFAYIDTTFSCVSTVVYCKIKQVQRNDTLHTLCLSTKLTKGLMNKETAVLRRWESITGQLSIINLVDNVTSSP